MYVSAKRVCGNDRDLMSTVLQWAAQAPVLGENDLLVLAVAEPRESVKHSGCRPAETVRGPVADLSGRRERKRWRCLAGCLQASRRPCGTVF